MTRINTLSQLAASQEPPPPGVWSMTMTVLGAAFGARSSALSQETVQVRLKRSVR